MAEHSYLPVSAAAAENVNVDTEISVVGDESNTVYALTAMVVSIGIILTTGFLLAVAFAYYYNCYSARTLSESSETGVK